MALYVITAVGYQLHLVKLIPHSRIYVEFAYGQCGGQITCTKSIVTTIVVAHAHLLQQSELVIAKVLAVGEQLRHVHLAEAFWQVVRLHVPVVYELTGAVVSCAILAIGTNLHSRLERSNLEVMTLVDVYR